MKGTRKKPNAIFKRDGEFTQTIGKTAPSKPNALSVIAQELRGKLDGARPVEPAEVRPEAVTPIEQMSQPEQVMTLDPPVSENPPQISPPQAEKSAVGPDKSNGDSPDTTTVEHGMEAVSGPKPEADASVAPPATTEPDKGRAGDTDACVSVALTIRIHSDLVKRAETWAAAVGLPTVTLLRNSLNRFKPELAAELKKVKPGDVHLERAESVGRHMQTRVQFTPAAYAEMEARLDPAGFGVLRSMLNHYARARFSAFLDELMADAGY